MPRALVTLALLLAADVPDALPDGGRHGYASAYAPGVMEGVVRWRLDTGTWRTPAAARLVHGGGLRRHERL